VAVAEISVADPRTPDVRALLERHLRFAAQTSPPEDVHALGEQELLDPEVTLYGFRADGRLLGLGALKRLDDAHAELKSMHTAVEARGQGVGRAMVEHLCAVARARGFRRLSLETGTTPEFHPARQLYVRTGFVTCPPFGSYRESRFSTFFTLPLEPPG
jgi:putative acetyltransferase